MGKHSAATKGGVSDSFLIDNRGVTAIEYCLIGALISLIAMSVIPNAFSVVASSFAGIRTAVGK